jgi:hypothetical protein
MKKICFLGLVLLSVLSSSLFAQSEGHVFYLPIVDKLAERSSWPVVSVSHDPEQTSNNLRSAGAVLHVNPYRPGQVQFTVVDGIPSVICTINAYRNSVRYNGEYVPSIEATFEVYPSRAMAKWRADSSQFRDERHFFAEAMDEQCYTIIDILMSIRDGLPASEEPVSRELVIQQAADAFVQSDNIGTGSSGWVLLSTHSRYYIKFQARTRSREQGVFTLVFEYVDY